MLTVISVEEAVKIIEDNFSLYETGTEYIETAKALKSILAQDILSDETVPAFDRSCVDGFAVNSRDTFGCSEAIPAELKITGEILMGRRADKAINRGECVRIPTGGMLPQGADSVVMSEYTSEDFPGLCHIYKSTAPLENITRAGDDIKKGSVILKKGTEISSLNIGALCAAGKDKIKIYKKPVAGIISTGDEIIPYYKKPEYGQIRNINTALLSSLLEEHYCTVKDYGIIKDCREEISDTLKKALSECDAVILSGGSSAGTRDMTAEIIKEQGEILFHGLAMKPGKPTVAGKAAGKAVFGMPGHPAAAYFSALSVIIPYIDTLLKRKTQTRTVMCTLSSGLSSNGGREEIVCVEIRDTVAFPILEKSGIISVLSAADGYVRIPRNTEGIKKGTLTEVNLL